MAFSVRLTGRPVRSGEPAFTIEPSWWPAGELRSDPRLRESVNDGYLDYQAELSIAEARALHERFRAAAVGGVFDCGPWQEIIWPMLAELDAVFGPRAAEFAGFTLSVFEWESGF